MSWKRGSKSCLFSIRTIYNLICTPSPFLLSPRVAWWRARASVTRGGAKSASIDFDVSDFLAGLLPFAFHFTLLSSLVSFTLYTSQVSIQLPRLTQTMSGPLPSDSNKNQIDHESQQSELDSFPTVGEDHCNRCGKLKRKNEQHHPVEFRLQV